jgi:hypothetical protein
MVPGCYSTVTKEQLMYVTISLWTDWDQRVYIYTWNGNYKRLSTELDIEIIKGSQNT